MRTHFDEQLSLLNKKMIEMGAFCEKLISVSCDALNSGDIDMAKDVMKISEDADTMERSIENLCLKLFLKEQPIASDLREISAALKMITDMKRIADQAQDIAQIVVFLKGRKVEYRNIKEMSKAVTYMVNLSVDAYVRQDEDTAVKVIEYDDVVDEYFSKVKTDLIELIKNKNDDGEYFLDILMIAKYLERIGDHAVNVAGWVMFSITGVHKDGD